jgi:hypothetical protein
MTLRKKEVIRRFLNGEQSGRASREELREVNGYNTIIGYGWAVYALDFGDTMALFGDGYSTDNDAVGWARYSGQSVQHIQEIKGMLEKHGRDYVVVDYQFQLGDLQALANPQDSIRKLIEKHEVEPRQGEGYLPR